MLRILVGSPIRQKPAILREFLASLKRLEQTTFALDILFVDDCDVTESKKILREFVAGVPRSALLSPSIEAKDLYVCNEQTHHWKEENVWKVASYKDKIIESARRGDYDYLFLVDSDLVLHPRTIEQLLLAKKEIVANLFWTQWYPNMIPLPQVWVSDHYTLFDRAIGEQISDEEAGRRQAAFLAKLQGKGVFEVGGLGACTLLSRAALQKPISFARIKNLTFWGEDRHFCVRALALGLQLFVDTHYPAHHIYRETDLAGVEEFCKRTSTPRITLSLIVHNEANRYLRRMLEAAKTYITDAVIIDDGSTDGSSALCEEVLKGIPLRLIKNRQSKFSNEVSLRKQQWEETIATNPDWILSLDADEIFEQRAAIEMKKMTADPVADAFCFRLYDFWDEEHYRSDRYWCAHNNYRPFLIRYRLGMEARWNEMAQHCGRFPALAFTHPKTSHLRLKHYGWAKPEERQAKYNRYQKLDPGAQYGWKEQYDSILDQTPNLVTWREEA